MSADHPHGPHAGEAGPGHQHGDPSPRPRVPAPEALDVPGSGPPTVDDPGSIALSEALRSSFFVVRIILAGLLGYFLISNVWFVGTQERAIVLRFGKPIMRGGQMEQGPGLVWAFPYPIDEVVRIPVTQLQTAVSTVGWYAVTAAQESAGTVPDFGASLNPAAEGYAITGDGNIIHARAFVRYRITEPVKYYLNHRNGAELMTNIVDNALTFAAAVYRVDDALRRDQAGFKEAVLKRATELVLAHDLGVTIEPSDVVTIPPRQVTAEFNAVLTAEADRGKAVSEARSYRNRVVNEARGDAEARVNGGRRDRNRLIQDVSSQAQRFASLLPEYLKNPTFFRRRLQTETLRTVFTNAQQKFPIPPRGPNDQLWLHINRDPEPAPKPPPL